MGLVDLGERLTQLERPGKKSPLAEWDAFAQALQALIDEFRDLSGIVYLRQWDEADERFVRAIEWGDEQYEAYTQYLKGTALLIDCLQLAAVSDRAGIEERLFRPAAA